MIQGPIPGWEVQVGRDKRYRIKQEERYKMGRGKVNRDSQENKRTREQVYGSLSQGKDGRPRSEPGRATRRAREGKS